MAAEDTHALAGAKIPQPNHRVLPLHEQSSSGCEPDWACTSVRRFAHVMFTSRSFRTRNAYESAQGQVKECRVTARVRHGLWDTVSGAARPPYCSSSVAPSLGHASIASTKRKATRPCIDQKHRNALQRSCKSALLGQQACTYLTSTAGCAVIWHTFPRRAEANNWWSQSIEASERDRNQATTPVKSGAAKGHTS